VLRGRMSRGGGEVGMEGRRWMELFRLLTPVATRGFYNSDLSHLVLSVTHAPIRFQC